MIKLNFSTTYLQEIEAEAIFILREVAAQFEKPVLMYSVGKDSSVLLRLAQKAFHPNKIPFPLLHIDTGFKFKEMYEFRDRMAADLGVPLIVHRNKEAIKQKANPYSLGTRKCCSLLKTEALLQALSVNGFDAAIGGARRDEEKSRAKERIFSFRDEFGQWDPRNQRPELWNIYNGRKNPGQSIRVFPLSNWTELDVWHYIHLESIPVVPLYLAKKRRMVLQGKNLIPADNLDCSLEHCKVEEIMCRFRTLGCSPCTGAILSQADSIPKIIEEMMLMKTSERATRIIDHDSEASMEMKKREGYF